METHLSICWRKGRGALSNKSGRFEKIKLLGIDANSQTVTNGPEKLRTTIKIDSARNIITKNTSPDIPFDRSINPYRGCEHGCIYCFARPTHAYLGLSAGLDFETQLFYKPDAAELLRRELDDPKYVPGVILLGANTDPYQPVEREKKLTRQILGVLAEYNHPVSIVTKSDLVLRDADIIAPMAANGMAAVTISITTLDSNLARKLEPRAPTPRKRLAAISSLTAIRVPTSVFAAPMIPGLNDSELENIFETASSAGATAAGYVLLRLPLETANLFREWLEENYPNKAARILNLIKQTRRGAIYTSAWKERFIGSGPYADLLNQRFNLSIKKCGLICRNSVLDISQFKRPPKTGSQLELF